MRHSSKQYNIARGNSAYFINSIFNCSTNTDIDLYTALLTKTPTQNRYCYFEINLFLKFIYLPVFQQMDTRTCKTRRGRISPSTMWGKHIETRTTARKHTHTCCELTCAVLAYIQWLIKLHELDLYKSHIAN